VNKVVYIYFTLLLLVCLLDILRYVYVCFRLGYTTSQRCSGGIADIVLVLDETVSYATPRSSSVWTSMRSFTAAFVNAFSVSRNTIHFGVAKYSESVDIAFYLYRYVRTDDVAFAVRGLTRMSYTEGGANLARALRDTRTNILNPLNGARPEVAKIVLLVTDGRATIDTRMTVPEAELLKDAGVEIFTVGITNDVDSQLLRNVSASPAHFYYASDVSRLGDILAALVNHTCRAVTTVRDVVPGSRSTSSKPTTRPLTTTTTTTSTTTTTATLTTKPQLTSATSTRSQ